MATIKQLIINAIIKISSENPAEDREGQPSAIEARDEFIRRLMLELFPADPAPVSAPAQETPKKQGKEDDIQKAARKAWTDAKKAKKQDEAPALAPTPVPEPASEPALEPVPEPAPETPKRKRAAMSDEAKASMKAKRAATIAAKKAEETELTGSSAAAAVPLPASPVQTTNAGAGEPPAAPKKGRKPKADADANLPKMDATWRKHLKHADKDHAKDLEPQLLTYLNAMSKEEFNSKKAEEHIAEFLASRGRKASEVEKVETDLTEVDFQGKTYYVNPETRRVYEGEGEYSDDVGWSNYKGVGYVGMAAFADMKLDE